MSTTGRGIDGIPGGTRRSWISTATFDEYFYSYTGKAWGPNPGTPQKCPSGRVLRENGKKLYPSAYPQVDQYYVGVYDSETLLNGYIDPNNAVFTPYNSDKPTHVKNSTDAYAADSTPPTISPYPDAGPSVWTNGSVTVNAYTPNEIANNEIIIGNDICGGNVAKFYMDNNDQVPGRTPRLQIYTSMSELGSYEIFAKTNPEKAQFQVNDISCGFIDLTTSLGNPELTICNQGQSDSDQGCDCYGNRITLNTDSDESAIRMRDTNNGTISLRTEVATGPSVTLCSNDVEGCEGNQIKLDATSDCSGNVCFTGVLRAPYSSGRTNFGNENDHIVEIYIDIPPVTESEIASVLVTPSVAMYGSCYGRFVNERQIVVGGTDDRDRGKSFNWLVIDSFAGF